MAEATYFHQHLYLGRGHLLSSTPVSWQRPHLYFGSGSATDNKSSAFQDHLHCDGTLSRRAYVYINLNNSNVFMVFNTTFSITPGACKRSHSFCQKCRWQITANMHAPYICGFVWNDIVHGCMVYTERAKTAAVLCGTSHASVVSTPLQWIFKKNTSVDIKKTIYNKLAIHVESHVSAVSLLEWRKAINNLVPQLLFSASTCTEATGMLIIKKRVMPFKTPSPTSRAPLQEEPVSCFFPLHVFVTVNTPCSRNHTSHF